MQLPRKLHCFRWWRCKHDTGGTTAVLPQRTQHPAARHVACSSVAACLPTHYSLANRVISALQCRQRRAPHKGSLLACVPAGSEQAAAPRWDTKAGHSLAKGNHISTRIAGCPSVLASARCTNVNDPSKAADQLWDRFKAHKPQLNLLVKPRSNAPVIRKHIARRPLQLVQRLLILAQVKLIHEAHNVGDAGLQEGGRRRGKRQTLKKGMILGPPTNKAMRVGREKSRK